MAIVQLFKSSSLLKVSALALTLGGAFVAEPASAAFKVIGYFPTWAGDVNTIQYNKLTHINYAFVLPTPSGGLQALDGGGVRLQSVVQKAHADGVKVMISVGGWNNGDDSAFVSLAANSNYRTAFVNSLINFVNQYNLDGVDIDWEYPNAGAEANNYRTLMQQLGSAMHSRGKLLTAAVTADDSVGSIDSAVINAVDFLNLMVYDMGYPHSTYQHAQNALSHWRYNEGLPVDKMVLGLPFYSHKDWVAYKDVIARYGAGAAQIDNAGGLDYNGQPIIRAKSQLALNESGGVMFWELSQDTRDGTSLLNTIWEVVGTTVQQGGGGTSTDGGNNNGGGTTDGGSGGTSGGAYPEWQAGKNYNVGDIVRYNGSLYITVNANPGYDPVISHWFWDPYTDTNTGGGTSTGGGASNGTTTLVNGKTYRITAKHSGRVVDVAGVSASNGADIHQWSYVGGNNQKWTAVDKGNGYWQLRAVHSGKCIDVDAWGQNNGSNIIQWSCHDGGNQQFKLDDQGNGYVYLRARHSNKCVDVSGVSTSNGASIHQWECVGQDNAKWKFEAVQ
jgi:chitinase